MCAWVVYGTALGYYRVVSNSRAHNLPCVLSTRMGPRPLLSAQSAFPSSPPRHGYFPRGARTLLHNARGRTLDLWKQLVDCQCCLLAENQLQLVLELHARGGCSIMITFRRCDTPILCSRLRLFTGDRSRHTGNGCKPCPSSRIAPRRSCSACTR